MNEKWAQVREKIVGFWNQYSKAQKWVLASTAALLIFAIILLTYLFTRTEYELAFQNLDSTDAAAIIEYLDGNGISYQLNDAGTSISVPSASASKVKVDVGSQGLVQNGSIGFEEMSKSSSTIGTTDQEFDVKYRNALNGEIQQLLLSKQGIAKVKAIVTLPEESVFLNEEDKEKASAAVVITFKPGFRPKQEEVDSYYNLVKSAVPNLDVKDVTISSSTGDLPASSQLGGGSAIGGALYETQFAIQNEFENTLKRNIQQFLNPIVGMDNMVVSVVSALNFDKITSQEQLVQPLADNDNKGIEISTQETSETSTGSSGQSGGVAGTGETDISNYPGGGSSGSSSTEKVSTTKNYEVNRITNNIDYGPYKVKDLSINVGVDSANMTPEKLAEIQGVILRHARVLLAESGLDLSDEALGQRVSVMSQSFSGNEDASGGASPSTFWLAGAGLLALALLGGGGYYLYRRRKSEREAAELEAMPRAEMPTIDIDNVANESQVRKQLESLAKRKPDEFVNLLRTWLVDE
ncbi:flagellar basal-body MS-ring/collar protein FliF [Cohnella luojiensis]|uniref:Flagellar M-ring protein n=1 Tax=Cohnella luojiensis TaxID=652876 RepID=A0A4Y8LSU3_9BACL|nr:flagellar basal-body MS-ring/collar protein FliF [Cohnella luojiensis]TFE24432.1 flagellar M-ring protein FliF [Cohnella luojiensis]